MPECLQTVNVTVKLSDMPDALVVPHGPNGPYVYLVVDGRAIIRPVTVRFDDSEDAAVVGDLKPGNTRIPRSFHGNLKLSRYC